MLKTKYITLCIITITLLVFCEKKAEFIEPAPGTQITTEQCTLFVNTPYPVDSTSFSIEYISERGTIKKRKIGTLTRPPYRVLLETKDIPNQYYNGATINAEIFRGDTLEVLKASHVYILPTPIEVDTLPLYQKGYTSKETISLISAARDHNSSLRFNHQNNTLKIQLRVESKVKKLSSPHNLTDKEISIILDPTMNRYPYVNNNIVTFKVPLRKQEQTQLISTYIDTLDNTFTIQRTPTPITLKKSISIEDNGSYSITVEIPALLIGGEIPKQMGINIIAPHPNNGTAITLVAGSNEEQLAPILYPILKQEIGKQALVTEKRTFFLFFLIGIGVALLLLAVTLMVKKFSKKLKTTKVSTIDIPAEVSKEILDPNLTPEKMAKKLKVSKSDLQKNCYSITGKSLQNYINWLRVELIKERLISSNSNEIDIAKSCGFSKVADMEALFLKSVGVAPYKFREKNKISIPS